MEPGSLPQESPPSPIQPRGFFAGVKVRPIVIGAVVDYLATSILGILYLIFFFVRDTDGLSEEALEQAWKEMVSSPEGLFGLVILGAFCTALGGYVAARSAKAEEMKHGALVGAVSLVFGLLQASMVGEQAHIPNSYEFLAYVLAIPVGALGGYLGQKDTTPGPRTLTS